MSTDTQASQSTLPLIAATCVSELGTDTLQLGVNDLLVTAPRDTSNVSVPTQRGH